MKKNSEKREKARFRVPTLVKYKGDPHFEGYQVANIRDISLRGMAFLTHHPVAKGCSLDLCFLAPDGEALDVKGAVLHCRKITKNPDSFKVGVRFEAVHGTVLEWLGKAEKFFLEAQKKKKG